jgi:hypothetical protein
MLGCITEHDLEQADAEFPGIAQFFETLVTKPRTFLELLSQFERWCQVKGSEAAGDTPRRSAR